MTKGKLEAKNVSYTSTNSIPVCPLHPDLDCKITDILTKVTDIQLKLAKDEGAEEEKEKQQQKEEKKSDNKISYWNQVKFTLFGVFLTFLFMVFMKLIEHFTPL